MSGYTEMQVGAKGDPESIALAALAHGRPYVFLTCDLDDDGGLTIKADAGGGLTSTAEVRGLIKKALGAMPGPAAGGSDPGRSHISESERGAAYAAALEAYDASPGPHSRALLDALEAALRTAGAIQR